MSYTKNIAVISGLKDGFSADGGKISGLIKAEKYYNNLKIEISLLNFAPLSEGRYVCAVSDGKSVQIVENGLFEGESPLNTAHGFAAMIFYINGGVYPVASAICGDMHAAAFGLKEEVERTELGKLAPPQKKDYEDDAIAEDNYYEFEGTAGKADEDGQPVCEAEKQKEEGRADKDEEDYGPVQKPRLARGGFYQRVKAEVEGLFAAYPPCAELNEAVEGSRWIKICYDAPEKYYVFGEIYSGGEPAYLCFGVPGDPSSPPESLKGISQFFPTPGGGYWVMFQDAETGAEVRPVIG